MESTRKPQFIFTGSVLVIRCGPQNVFERVKCQKHLIANQRTNRDSESPVMIICISHYDLEREYLRINKDNTVQEWPGLCSAKTINGHTEPLKKSNKKQSFKTLRLVIDGITAYYLIREIRVFTEFRKRIYANPALTIQLLWLQLVPPEREIIDYKWNDMLMHTLWERIEADYLMSWLSTLGGGFSALGEQFTRCAETAGKISLKQLSLGMRLGDPFLQARCKLFYSISLIQIGRVRAAKYIVREQHRFALPHRETDGRLLKMCQGIWLRIQYEYSLRLKDRQRQRHLGAGDK